VGKKSLYLVIKGDICILRNAKAVERIIGRGEGQKTGKCSSLYDDRHAK